MKLNIIPIYICIKIQTISACYVEFPLPNHEFDALSWKCYFKDKNLQCF